MHGMLGPLEDAWDVVEAGRARVTGVDQTVHVDFEERCIKKLV
jgi:hypothetical protein